MSQEAVTVLPWTRRDWRQSVAVWGGLWLVTALETWLMDRSHGGIQSLWLCLFGQVGWLVWVGWTPVVFRVTERQESPRTAPLRWVAIRTGLLLFANASFGGAEGLARHFVPGRSGQSLLRDVGVNILGWTPISGIILVGISAMATARLHARRVQRGELREAHLKGELAEVQLMALRAQLQPHFLFNTLNGVLALVRGGENRAAARMLELLGSLLHQLLLRGREQFSSLEQELGFLRSYLEIQTMRFSDRLVVKWDIAPDLLGLKVPSLLLQPLAENSIRHGISRRTGKGTVSIHARRAGNHLELTVEDDGPGFPTDFSLVKTRGVGLSNTRERLESLFAHDAELHAERAASGGARVRILLPLAP